MAEAFTTSVCFFKFKDAHFSQVPWHNTELCLDCFGVCINYLTKLLLLHYIIYFILVTYRTHVQVDFFIEISFSNCLNCGKDKLFDGKTRASVRAEELNLYASFEPHWMANGKLPFAFSIRNGNVVSSIVVVCNHYS